jgi:hypothetical protein
MPTPSDRIILGYARAVADVRSRVVQFATASWNGMPDYRDADVDRMVRLVVPVVAAGQTRAASLTVAYLRALADAAGVALPGAVDASVTAYRGVPAVDVYRRPAVTLYTALSNGVSFTDAKAQGLTRLVSLASTDIQQARNRQAATSIAGSGFKSFSRVLSGTEDCELCTVAADRTYYRGDLMPIHPGCDCGVIPNGFGRAADPVDGARETAVHEHGEYGLTLAWAGEHFTGPDDF